MKQIVQLWGLANGAPSSLDRMFLVEYDPTRPGASPDGELMTAHIAVTPDRHKARTFNSKAEAYQFCMQSHGTRPDGKPNRPLTAYSVSIEPL